MMRWIIRLAVAGLVAAVLAYLWSRFNEDFDDEELDDEIPIDFDVPLDTTAIAGDRVESVRVESVPADSDTGEGPGASLTLSNLTSSSDGATTTNTQYDDLTVIRGIGPVFQKRLNDAGIRTLRQLADADALALEAAGIEGVGVDLTSWIQQARALGHGRQA